MVIVLAISNNVNTRPRTYIDTHIPDWVGEEVSDGSVDIERTHFNNSCVREVVWVCRLDCVYKDSLCVMRHLCSPKRLVPVGTDQCVTADALCHQQFQEFPHKDIHSHSLHAIRSTLPIGDGRLGSACRSKWLLQHPSLNQSKFI